MPQQHNGLSRPDITNLDAMLLDPAQREVDPRAGMLGHCRMFSRAKTIDQANRTIDFVASTGTIDRYGEIVEPEAFRDSLDAFMANPAFPAGHWYEFTAGKSPTVGKWLSMSVESTGLIGKAWFKPRGLGEEVWLDYLDGCLTSVSVAFLTRAWEMREMDVEGVKRRVRVFTSVDLLEVSAVLIPANPQARLRAASYMPGGQLPGSGISINEPLLKRVCESIERFERMFGSDDDPFTPASDHDGYRLHAPMDDAEAGNGRDGSAALGYFGDDIPGEGEPDPRAASTGDDHELKSELRSVLGNAPA